jgi:amino acid transporter
MIFAFSTNQTSNLFDVNNSAVGSKNVNFSAIMSALPGVLFAFNGFFAIGDIKDEIDQPNKKVPLAIIVSTLVIAAIYVGCSITLAINGNSQGMILMAFGEKGVPYISAVLCLVTVGSVCSLQGNANHNCDKFIKTDILFCSKGLDNLNNKKAGLGGLVLSLSALLIHVLVFVVPSMIIDTDDLIDISSNFLSFFVFILLSMIMVSFLIKSFDKKSEVKCNIFIKISAIISILALVFSTCYLALYVPINDFITKPLE